MTTINTNSLVSLISRLNRQIAQAMEAPIAEIGLSTQEFRIAGLLLGETGISQKELAQKLSVRPATLSVALDRLESKGVIKRLSDPNDLRVNLLSLNPDFDLGPSNTLLETFEHELTQHLSKSALTTTLNVLTKISNQLDASRSES